MPLRLHCILCHLTGPGSCILNGPRMGHCGPVAAPADAVCCTSVCAIWYAQSEVGKCSTVSQRRPSYVFDTPANYRVRVLGPMDKRRSEYLCGMSIASGRRHGGPIVTTLTGELVDQAALVGVLNSLYDMGYPLLKVERLGPSPPVDL